MKIKIVAGIILLSVNGALASARTEYLAHKVNEAHAVELQSRAKYRAEEARYKASKKYTSSLRNELKDTLKREANEYKQARKAYQAEYLRVGSIDARDMTAPVSLNWKVR